MAKDDDVQITLSKADTLVRLKFLSYTVQSEKDGWLEIVEQGKSGWVKKRDVVLRADAIEYFTNRIKANPREAGSYNRRAHAWIAKGKVDNAIKDYSDAIRLNPNESAYYNNRGYLWYKQGKHDKALKDFDEAVHLFPKYALAYYNRGNVWQYGKKNVAKALADYNEAITLAPDFQRAYIDRGNLWLNRKQDYDKAVQDFSQVIRLNPKSALAFYLRGFAHNKAKAYAKSLKDYDEAIRLYPKYTLAYNNKAWILATCPDDGIRNGPKAVKTAKKACELSKMKNGFYFDTLAAAYAENGQFDLAVQAQRKALENDAFLSQYGVEARERLLLFMQKKPYREK